MTSAGDRIGRWCQLPVSVYADTEDGLRHATWLELFFDLVFVVSIAELGTNLHHHLTVGGLAEFVVLFAVVRWVWLNISHFADVFDTDDPTSVAMIVASMFGVIFLSQTTGEAFHGGSFAFGAAVRCSSSAATSPSRISERATCASIWTTRSGDSSTTGSASKCW